MLAPCIAASFKKTAIVNPGRREQPEAKALPASAVAEVEESAAPEVEPLFAEPETVVDMTPIAIETAFTPEAIATEMESAFDMDSIFGTAADDIPETPKPAAPKKHGAQNTRTSENAAPIAVISEQEPKKPKRRKKEKVDENQLSLFDFAAYAA